MLLGIDVGTSSVKGIILDPDRASVAVAREPLRLHQPDPETAEMDPEDWWTAMVGVIQRLRAEHPEMREAVRAIGISTIFPALVVMRRDGTVLRRAILYCDRRSSAQARRASDLIGRKHFEQLTHNRLTPGTCTLPVVMWLRDREPGIFARTEVFGQATTCLVHRLCGEFALDYTQASLSGLVRAGHEDTWDADLLAVAGLEPDRLPPLRPTPEVVGLLSAAAAEACGLRPGVPVVAGAGDAPLAAVGGGVTDRAQLFGSAGSTDCLMLTSDRPPANPVFVNGRFPLPHLWLSTGTMSTGGAAAKWLRENVLEVDATRMTELAEQAPAGSGGLVFMPYLQGERTPWWDPAARGVLLGVTLATRREDISRAVLEGVAYGWRQIVDLLERELGGRVPSLTVVGGGSTNRLWNRIKASALGRPLRVLDFSETTALGAAMVAGLGVGDFATPEAARDATEALRSARIVDPVPAWEETYDHLYRTYELAYPAVKALFPAP